MRNVGVKVGTTSGRLTVIDKIEASAGKHQRLICQCACGKIRDVASHNFKKGKHCSCLTPEKTLVGQVFGKVTIKALVRTNQEAGGKNGGHVYQCQCNQCSREMEYSTSAIKRKGFTGCRCPSDPSASSRQSIYCNYKRNAKVRGIYFDLSFEEFVALAESNCAYCGIEPSNKIESRELAGKWEYNGVDRVDNAMGYFKSNLIPCCKRCNFMKSNFSRQNFLDHVKRIYEHNK